MSLNINFDNSKAKQSSIWSATVACMSFLCFLKCHNPYFYRGLYPPHLLLHFYMHFII